MIARKWNLVIVDFFILFGIYSPKSSWSNAFKPESIIVAITSGLHQIWSYIVASSAGAAVLVSPLGIQPSNFQLARTPFDGQAQMMRTSVITTFEQNQFHHKNTPSPTVVLVNRKLPFLGKHVWPIVTSWHAMPCIIHWPTFINLSQNLVALIVSKHSSSSNMVYGSIDLSASMFNLKRFWLWLKFYV